MPAPLPLKWLPGAVEDLVRLRAFLEIHDPRAAKRAGAKILSSLEKLRSFPQFGRPVQDIEPYAFRDLFIPFGQAGYWLRYAVTKREILLIHLWHGKEDRQSLTPTRSAP